MKTLVQTLLQPISPERRRVNAGRFLDLPDSLKTPEQIIGFAHHSCGATHGVLESCDFACTSCYLGEEANAAEPLSREEVFQQLDQLREFLGPQGKAQITAGEVTLLPREVLGEYVRYAIDIGLDPMVMTHGRRFLQEPEYLQRLIEEDGLEKISIHVDATQRGREEWSPFVTEEQLHPVRDRYASLIREMRAKTGRRLHAAHTVTVTQKNLDQIPAVMSWLVRNLDAFRMVSFQPVAEVGRTQDQAISDLNLTDLWERIGEALGKPLNRDAMHFGHPECHIMIPVVVARVGEQLCVLETARAGKRWDRSYLRRLLQAVGGYTVRGKSRGENLLGIASLTLRNPLLLFETPFYGLYRIWGDRKDLVRIILQAVRRRTMSVRPLALVVHKFMSSGELETPLGRERLQACTFRVPVEGEMIPMCQLNATGLRSKLYPAASPRKVVGES
ncbi:MAG: hypothetical protein WBO54_13520 [Thermoanaerobaculia bacterium]